MPEFTSPRVEEFYNHAHDTATGRFSGRAASGKSTAYTRVSGSITVKGGRTSTYTVSPTGVKTGRPVTGTKLSLRNATTGRINPLPVRHAFKQGLSEIIGKKQDSKRTTLKATGPVRRPNDPAGHVRKPLRKTETVGTYKGRVFKHISSKGGAHRAGFREGG